MPTVTTPQTTIHYQFDVAPGKPVLVLSNSLATNLSMWSHQVPEFSKHFSLLRYDTRGHGQSAVPKGPYTIEQLARDVLALLNELKIEKAHFCGLSMGGMVGQWLGAHAPERLLSLVLSDSAAEISAPDFWNPLIATARTRGMDALARDFIKGWFTESFFARRPDETERVLKMILGTPAEGYASCCEAIRDMDQRATAKTITAPTLVAYGRNDMATPPELSKFLLAEIKGAEELVFDSAHVSNIEDAEAFTRGVLEFLLRQDPKA
jgi:3-oxoadipate enol-lactonase